MARSAALTSPRAGRSAPNRRVLVVWNPEAGSKAGLPTNGTSEAELRRVLADHGLGDDLFLSQSPAAAAFRVDQAVRDGVDVVVAAGGDGTARSVALRLLGKQTALGLLPLGSAMNLARSLGIPRELDKAANVIATGEVRAIDIGEIAGRPFIEQVSVGLSAEAFAKAHAVDKRRFGAVLGLLRLVRKNRRTRIELELDGEVRRSRALALSIANTPYTGLGIELAPDARLDDGLLDVVVFESLSPLGLARYMAATIGGRGEPPERFRTYRAKRVRIDTRRPLPVRFDAEDGGRTPVEIRVLASALRVVAPA
jgi:diacylglycerol kinase (ATP)